MGEYYGNNDWRDYKALRHYGVKGMKWHKRKNKNTIQIFPGVTDNSKNYGTGETKYHNMFQVRKDELNGYKGRKGARGYYKESVADRKYVHRLANQARDVSEKKRMYSDAAWNSSKKVRAKRAVMTVINSIKYRKKREKNKYGKRLKSNKRMYVKNIG